MDYLGGGVVREEISSSAGRGLRYRFDGERLEAGEDGDESRAVFARRIEGYAALASGKGKVRVWAEIQEFEPGRLLEISNSGRPLKEDQEPTHAKLERVLGFVYWAMRDAASIWGEGFGPLSPQHVFGDDRKAGKRGYCLEPGFGWVRGGDTGRIRRATEEDDVRSLGEFCFEVAANRYGLAGTDKMLRVPFPRGHRVWQFLSDGDAELERLWRQRRCEELVSWVGGRATLSAIEDRMPPRPKGLATPGAIGAVQRSARSADGDRQEGSPAVGEAGSTSKRERAVAAKKVPRARPEPKGKKESPARAARDPLPWAKIGVATAVLLAVVALGWGGWQALKPKAATAGDVRRLALAVEWLGDVAREGGRDGLDAIVGEGLDEEVQFARWAMDLNWEKLVVFDGSNGVLVTGFVLGEGVPSVWEAPGAGGPIRDASKRLEAAQHEMIGVIGPWRERATDLEGFVRDSLGATGLGDELGVVLEGLVGEAGTGVEMGQTLKAWVQGRVAVRRAAALRGVWDDLGGDELVGSRSAGDPIRRAIRAEMMDESATADALREVIGVCKQVAGAQESSDQGSLKQDIRDRVRTRVSDSDVGESAKVELVALVDALKVIVDTGPLVESRRLFALGVSDEREAMDASVDEWSKAMAIERTSLASAWSSKLDELEEKHGGDTPDLDGFVQASGSLRTRIERVHAGAMFDLAVTEGFVGGVADWGSIGAMVEARRAAVIDGLLVGEGIISAGAVPDALTPEGAKGFEQWLAEVDRVVGEVVLLGQGLARMMLAGEAYAPSDDPSSRTFAEVTSGLNSGRDGGGDVAEIFAGLGTASEAILARAKKVVAMDDGGESIDGIRADLHDALADGSSPDPAVAHAAWRALEGRDEFPAVDHMGEDMALSHAAFGFFVDRNDQRFGVWEGLEESLWHRGWDRWSKNGSGELGAWVEVADAIMALHPGDDDIASVDLAQIEVNREILAALGDGGAGTAGARERGEALYKSLQGRVDGGEALPAEVTTDLKNLHSLLTRKDVKEGALDFEPQEDHGWTVQEGGSVERVDLVHEASGERLSFVRLRDSSGADVGVDGKAVFLCTTEMSVGTVDAVLSKDELVALGSIWRELGDRIRSSAASLRLVVWDFDGSGLTVKDNILEDPSNDSYMTQTALPRSQRDPSWTNFGGSARMPLQEIGFVAASEICRSVLGGRLASVGEFGLALELEGVATKIFDADGTPVGTTWNVRDLQFDRQRKHALESGDRLKLSRRLYLDDQAAWEDDLDKSVIKAKAKVWSSYDDETTFFDEVDRGDRGKTMLNLVGNVAEWVTDDATGEARVIGASALSRPGLGFGDPITPELTEGYGAFDIGFRIAFDAKKQQGTVTVAGDDEIGGELGSFSRWVR